jgi:MerR family transcriptional regulator, thiopeptide resistance regulator
MSDRWLTPKEMASRFGVTVKTLRLYERHRLLAPLRTAAGWRVFGPDEAVKLHRILVLKGLGLSLRKIGEVINTNDLSLDAVLALQEGVLSRRKAELERALAALRSARVRLARTGRLSLEELVHLTQETQMSAPIASDKDWEEAFQPLVDRHYTAEEKAAIGANKIAAFKAAGYDQESFSRAWAEMFAELKALRAAGDQASARAFALLRRWNEMVSHFKQAHPVREASANAIWSEALSDPEASARLPISKEDIAFLKEIAESERNSTSATRSEP